MLDNGAKANIFLYSITTTLRSKIKGIFRIYINTTNN